MDATQVRLGQARYRGLTAGEIISVAVLSLCGIERAQSHLVDPGPGHVVALAPPIRRNARQFTGNLDNLVLNFARPAQLCIGVRPLSRRIKQAGEGDRGIKDLPILPNNNLAF